VYFVGPLSGPISNYGKEFNTGLKAAALVLNKQGGIDGHKVVITTADDQANPTQGIGLLTTRLTKTPEPNLVIPGIAAFENLPYAPVIMQHKILAFATQPDPTFNSPTKLPYLFNLNPAYQEDWSRIAAFTKSKGWKTIGIVANDDDAGTENVKLMQAAAAANGIKVLSVATYADTALDITPVWEKVVADKPQAVWVTTQGQSPVVFKSRQKAGITIPTVVDTSGTATPLASLLGSAAMVNTWGAAVPIQITPAAKRTANEKQYVAAISAVGGAPEYAVPALMYDSLMMVNLAADQAHSVATVPVTDALEDLTATNTAFGGGYPIHFSPTWHFATQLSAPSPYVIIPLSVPFKDDYYHLPS
jgi:branched-chain amino acid transport system substrate-binding protein